MTHATQPFILATRASPLALWQARLVARHIHHNWPLLRVKLLPLTSSGDKDTTTPLYGMGNVGVFAREVHEAVLDGRAHAGVHSCKDLPTTSPEGLIISALCRRHDPRDALIGCSLDALTAAHTIGSSSLRRRAQLSALCPGISFTDLRGNVQTRLRKVQEGQASGTLLAMAGLQRLGMSRSVRAYGLNPWTEMVPAPAQGIIAVDCRANDQRSRVITASLNHHRSAVAATIERSVLAGLRGGCSLPLGCYSEQRGSRWHAIASLGTDSGVKTVKKSGPAGSLAEALLSELL